MCSPSPISLFCIIMIIQRQYPVEADCLILLISWYIRILEWQNSDKLSISNDIPGILGFTYCFTNYLYIQMLNNDSIKQAYKNYSLGNLNDVLSALVVVNRINMKTETFLKLLRVFRLDVSYTHLTRNSHILNAEVESRLNKNLQSRYFNVTYQL